MKQWWYCGVMKKTINDLVEQVFLVHICGLRRSVVISRMVWLIWIVWNRRSFHPKNFWQGIRYRMKNPY